jgi:hypothetical protein
LLLFDGKRLNGFNEGDVVIGRGAVNGGNRVLGNKGDIGGEKPCGLFEG